MKIDKNKNRNPAHLNESSDSLPFIPPHRLAAVPRSSPILLAFSGGADSRALLHRLSEYCRETGAPLFAAHVNHGIRGDEALRDRDFCLRVAAGYGVECLVLDADVPAIARESGESTETAARRVRYAFFEKIMRARNIPLLATAHNADDRLETLIFNIARGTGLRGIASIPPSRPFAGGYIIRPFIKISKAEILDYCAELGLEYVSDSTNDDTEYSRNLIRHDIIPRLRELNPGVLRNAERLYDAARDGCDFIEKEALRALSGDAELKLTDGIPLSRLAPIHPVVRCRALAILCERSCSVVPESVHIRDMTALVLGGRGGSSVSLPGKKRALIEGGRLFFCPDTKERSPAAAEKFSVALRYGENPLPKGNIVLIEGARETYAGKLPDDTVSLPDELLPLTARSIREGDTIRQGGMTKKVRRLLAAAGIPARERHLHPIVCDARDNIVWIPLVARRDGVLPTNGGAHTLATAEYYNEDNHTNRKIGTER